MSGSNEVPVFYATTEGRTGRIAERMSSVLREYGLGSVALDVRSPEARAVDWEGVGGVVLGASVRAGTHQSEAVAFAREHRDALQARPSAFLSVSPSAASSDPETLSAARRTAHGFTRETGWSPRRVSCVPGRAASTRHRPPDAAMPRRDASREGGSADAGRDHEDADWAAVDRLAAEVAADVREVRARAASPPPLPGTPRRGPAKGATTPC